MLAFGLSDLGLRLNLQRVNNSSHQKHLVYNPGEGTTCTLRVNRFQGLGEALFWKNRKYVLVEYRKEYMYRAYGMYRFRTILKNGTQTPLDPKPDFP